ncbi:MAG: CocE/NonD family hydrolase, partial [Thaumarchaeota archaeon]|nr:CocE/NonD family hydrolase [Nitrososphaerota archaeon]
TSPRRSRSTRRSQKLIIGPWPHHVNSTRKIGDVDFGESALIDLLTVKLRWFDHWLKGIKNGIEKEPRVDLFTMGSNSWRSQDQWPPKGMIQTPYYLHSKGKANGSFGDGLLAARKPAKTSSSDTYCYDPADPVPNIDDMGQGAEGPFDQRPIERRDDVLVYSTPPLAREVEVSGPVTVGLFASTSARDTDFWAQLVDVYPSGYSMHLTEGIVRGRYNRSLAREELLRPGRVYEFKIDLWVINNSFMKGHRIRLDVSSSSFPKYDRNPNTGHAFGQDSVLLVAEQTVYHDLGRPSRIVLPIVPRGR